MCGCLSVALKASLPAIDLSLSFLLRCVIRFPPSSYGFLALVLHSGYTLKIRTATLTCLLVVDEWRMEF